MKTYKGAEIIKAAKYLQKMDTRSEIEAEFTLDSVDVEDRKVVVHYSGTIEQKRATLDVTVYKAKSYDTEYKAKMAGRVFKETDYRKVKIWLHSITKLKTEDAKAGKIELLPEEWKIVHKDFIEKFFKDFHIRKTEFPESFVAFPYIDRRSFGDIDEEFGLILLEYDPSLKDFKEDFNNYQFNLSIGISNDTKTLALGYYVHDYDKNLNNALAAILPNAKQGKCPLLSCYGTGNKYYYVEGTYDEILAICNGLKDRLYAHYDKIIKKCGGNPHWKNATGWTESGPVYPSGSAESAKAKELLDAKVNAKMQASIDRVAETVKKFYGIDIKTYFKNSKVECKGYQFADTVVITIPYKFPKVTGSKVVLVDKELTVKIYRDDYPNTWGDGRHDKGDVQYQYPGIYTTMSGEYTDFSSAKSNDKGRLMILKPTRKKATAYYDTSRCRNVSNVSVFSTIKRQLADLEEFVKYKGFKV